MEEDAANAEGAAPELPTSAPPSDDLWLHQQYEPTAASYRWRCCMHGLTESLKRSPIFWVGGFRWRMLAQLREDTTYYARDQHLGLYLESVDAVEGEEFFVITAQYKISIINLRNEGSSLAFPGDDAFRRGHTDWGTHSRFRTVDVCSPLNGFPVAAHGPREAIRPLSWEEFETAKGNIALILEANVHVDARSGAAQPRCVIGWVGLKNQGATCYLNALLQTLFHISSLRSAIFQLPTEVEVTKVDAEGDAVPRVSLPLALQRLFWHLQYSDEARKTKELTRAFGWAPEDAWRQQDIQELNRLLCDTLEQKMRGTPQEHCIQRLFVGETKLYVKCINVDYESSRSENFYDISVVVTGYRTLEEALAGSIKPERLDGSNKYYAEQHGAQDADTGTMYLTFPPVLMLHLKRFHFDLQTMRQEKLDDRFEFGPQLDVGRFTRAILRRCPDCGHWRPMRQDSEAKAPDLSPHPAPSPPSPPPPPTPSAPAVAGEDNLLAATPPASSDSQEANGLPIPHNGPVPASSTESRSAEPDVAVSSLCVCPPDHVPDLYDLHCVVVHVGGPERGHYYAYVRKGTEWLCFDDMRVLRCLPHQVFEESFGGRSPQKWWTQSPTRDIPTAYMLCYVRHSERHLVDDPTGHAAPVAVPEFLEAHMRRGVEADRRRRAAKELQRNSLKFHFATDAHLKKYWEYMSQTNTIGDGLFKFTSLNSDPDTLPKTTLYFDLLARLQDKYQAPDPRLYRWKKYDNRIPGPSQARRPSAAVIDTTLGEPITESTTLEEVFGDDPDTMQRLFVYTGDPIGSMSPEDASPTLLCCKYYEPRTKQLSYATSLLIADVAITTVKELFPVINRVMQLPPETPLQVYEETEPLELTAPLDPAATLRANNIVTDADVLVFERLVPHEEAMALECPNVGAFIDWHQSLTLVSFVDLHHREDITPVSVEFNANYTVVCEEFLRLMPRLQVGPEFLRLRPQMFNGVHPAVEHCRPDQSLQDMVTNPNHLVLFWEVLEEPLQTVGDRVNVDLSWYSDRQLRRTVSLTVDDPVCGRSEMTVLQLLIKLREILNLNPLGFTPEEYRSHLETAHGVAGAAEGPNAAATHEPLHAHCLLAMDAPEAVDQWTEDWCPLVCAKMQDPSEFCCPPDLFSLAAELANSQLKHFLRTGRRLEIRVERLPEKALDAERTAVVPGQELQQVTHAVQLRARLSTHSVPLLMYVSPDDTVSDVRNHLRALLCVRSDEFQRWRLWIHPPEGSDFSIDHDEAADHSLLDTYLTSSEGQVGNFMDGWRIVLEHPDPERREPLEKALRIDAL